MAFMSTSYCCLVIVVIKVLCTLNTQSQFYYRQTAYVIFYVMIIFSRIIL